MELPSVRLILTILPCIFNNAPHSVFCGYRLFLPASNQSWQFIVARTPSFLYTANRHIPLHVRLRRIVFPA